MEGKDNTQYALDILAGKSERTERRLHIEIRLLIAAIVLIVAGFLLYLNQYDVTSETTEHSQDGQGLNIIVDRNGVLYGTETEDYN